MSKVADKKHTVHSSKPRPQGAKPKPRPQVGGPITNFNQQAMDQQMTILRMQQAQMIQQFTKQIAGLQAQLQGGQAAPAQTAAQQAAQAAAEAQAQQQQAAQQAAFAAYQTQALAQFSGTGAAMQQTFAASMQGFGSLESSLGGFLNQGYAPAQFNGGAYSLTASASLFSGPISVPQLYPGARRY